MVDAGPRTAFLLPEHSAGQLSRQAARGHPKRGRGARGHLCSAQNGACSLFGRLPKGVTTTRPEGRIFLYSVSRHMFPHHLPATALAGILVDEVLQAHLRFCE